MHSLSYLALALCLALPGDKPAPPDLEDRVRALLRIADEHSFRNQRFAIEGALFAIGKKDESILKRIDDLQKELDALRDQSHKELIKMGQRDPKVVDALIKCLRSEEASERGWAASYLGHIGKHAEKAVPELNRVFADQKELDHVRSTAVSIMRTFGAEAIPFYLDGINSRDNFRRKWSTSMLGSIKDVLGDPKLTNLFVELLSDKDEDVRANARESFEEFGKASIPTLRNALKHPKVRTRAGAAEVITRLDIGLHEELLPILRILLHHDDSEVRELSALAFSRLGKNARPATDDLIRALRDSQEWVRYNAAHTLGEFGPDAEKATAELAKIVVDPKITVREASLLALEKIQRNPKVVVPAIVGYLEKYRASLEDEDALIYAIGALVSYGKEAQPALATLAKFRDHRTPHVRITATSAIQVIEFKSK